MTTAPVSFVGYHGTSSVHLPSLQQGIRAMYGTNYAGAQQLGEGFYVTDDYGMALQFARATVAYVRGQPTAIEMYAYGFASMRGYAVPRSLWWRIPQALITGYDYLIAPISDSRNEQYYQLKFNPQTCNALFTP